MGDTPFGFNRSSDDDGEGDGKPGDPFGMGFGPGGPGGGDMRQFADMLHQFADMLSGMGAGGSGPVNWEMVRNIARHLVVEAGDPSVVDAQRRQVEDALRLADLWLDEGTVLPAGVRSAKAWSRSEWLEATLPVWEQVVDPIAERMVSAMGGAMNGPGGQIPPEMAAMAGPLIGMVKQMAGAMVAGQAGQALGTLAKEIIGSADVGLPLAPEGVAALLPAGVDAFAEGLEIPLDEVRLYLALREAAHQRLFAHVPWLRSALLNAVGDYARGISVDLSGLEDKISGLDLSDPQALQEALGGEIQLTPEETPEQKAALARLETLLALVEGWVGVVVAAAAAGRLPSADRLAEAIRRRRATGGPAEHTFAALVGLELRPRRLREAEALWQSVTALKGVDGRDGLWAHPDLIPTADDLANPDAFLHSSDADFDLSQLDELPPSEDQGGDGAGGRPDA
ncbi:zinc-dependent metalloprotease [Actinocorallia sp. API 0066]|uniref:zinc-dependent metalloprotease n=1 Tax=Actinocorallia sp. API 0066 TaxID=2896846 RepID=UPI001E35F581|nr:zinc-dependent metalloprotease [Actinocorallia sp. API 0066]MCD0448102.1 zinc-dependent metalloprotease [Actinocorallia sp. API 0066]